MKTTRPGLDIRNRRNIHFVILMVAYFIIIIMPTSLDLLSPAPSSALQKTRVKIISANSISPNLVVEMTSGDLISANFAQSSMLFPIGKIRYFGVSADSISKLPGCSGWAEIDTTKNFLYPKYRVWALSCGGVDIEKQQSEIYFHSTRVSGFMLAALESALFFILVLVVHIANRRPYGRRK
ncbi:hypothetical protein [Burkholderia gladioli]|uniref:hypothetical protein n=1 Tax=Burkholderia gladioli TaxID=28095 RepID=UPI00163EE788|nr:hypothetical protein [Burkholderia gladioli]